jgi:coenzyme F420 hydrogenase subunit delta
MQNINSLDDALPDWYKKRVMVLGCGNVLMGDDGFGPAVMEALLERGGVPEDVFAMDIGLSARDVLFPMVISETHVKKIIIVDGVDFADKGRKPGEIFEIALDDIPVLKQDDFSMHQVPSSNLLKDLRDHRKIDVTVLACQIQHIPDEVESGLTEPVKAAVPGMCDLITKHWGTTDG